MTFLTPVFDVHTHAYPEALAPKAVQFLNDYYHVNCSGKGTIGDLTRSARESGVTWLLVHAVATKPTQVENINSWIAAHIGGNVLGFGSLHPGYPHIQKEIARLQELGLRGVKLHPDFQRFYVDSPEMDPIYSRLEGVMPVLIHAGDRHYDYSSPVRIRNVLRRYPGLTVIAAHLGGFSQWELAMDTLVGENLYFDTSSSACFLPPEKAREIIRAHGAGKVLFGTDYPLRYHSEELPVIDALGLSAEEKSAILFGNAKRLFGL